MIEEPLDELACGYALGALSTSDCAEFKRALRGDPALQQRVDELTEVAATLTVAASADLLPSPDAKERLFRRLDALREVPALVSVLADSAVVLTNGDGFVEWVNEAFTKMCGYELAELAGKKPGPVLQGERTDAAAAVRMREAIHQCQPFREELINYRKSGEPYRVSISISPIFDEHGNPRNFIAIEREITDHAIAA